MIVIVDIDGTIADLTHRLHFIEQKPPDWDAFHAHVAADKAIFPVIAVVRALAAAEHPIFMVSGRMEKCREDTINWLRLHKVPFDALFMRPNDDYRPDTEIKNEILTKIGGPERVLLAIDDRKRVVEMWRSHGIKTMQVAKGNY